MTIETHLKSIKKASLSLVILFILCLGISLPATSQTGIFIPKNGLFSVNFPAYPKMSQTIHNKVVGKIKEITYRVDTMNGNFSVTYSDLPGIAFDFVSPTTIIKKAKKALLKNAKGKEISFKRTNLAGNPVGILEFTIPKQSQSHEMQGLARFYLVKNRLFVLVATRMKGLELNSLNHFFNSFKLLKI